uniref:Uncharacterized protein n=1 Tax=Guillardia theta TaxID=55529 RepID=A0A7S4UL66_GUITH
METSRENNGTDMETSRENNGTDMETSRENNGTDMGKSVDQVRLQRIREIVKTEILKYSGVNLDDFHDERHSTRDDKSTARMNADRQEVNKLQNAPTRLEDACERTIPYFSGGFSRKSPAQG